MQCSDENERTCQPGRVAMGGRRRRLRPRGLQRGSSPHFATQPLGGPCRRLFPGNFLAFCRILWHPSVRRRRPGRTPRPLSPFDEFVSRPSLWRAKTHRRRRLCLRTARQQYSGRAYPLWRSTLSRMVLGPPTEYMIPLWSVHQAKTVNPGVLRLLRSR